MRARRIGGLALGALFGAAALLGAPSRARAMPESYWGFEPALGVASQSVTSESADGSETWASASSAQAVLQFGAFWQWRLTSTLWLGPKLQAAALTGAQNANRAFDLVPTGTFRWGEQGPIGARWVFGLGPSLALAPPPRSYAIRHEVSPALGVAAFSGIGIDRVVASGNARWYVDLRIDLRRLHEHDHVMIDTRTSERIRGTLRVSSAATMLVFGIGWHPR